MATEYALLTENGTSGSYWASLTTEQKARYYSNRAGQYIVFSSLNGIVSYPSTGGIGNIEAVVEVYDAFNDTASATSSSMPSLYSLTITTMINGVRTPAFHGGISGSGYRRTANSSSYSVIPLLKSRTTVDGLELINQNTTGGQAISLPNAAAVCVIKNNIVTGYRGITDSGAGSLFLNNIALNCTQYGFGVGYAYGAGSLWANNLAAKCGTGFSNASGSSCYSTFIGNAAVGCSVANWSTIPSNALASNNAGVSGDSPWNTFGTAITSLTADNTTFYDYANNDFRPASGSSPLVNANINWNGQINTDIIGKFRPDYESATYPDNLRDIGPFEYDHGEGNTPPASCNLTISAPTSLVGAEIRIYDNDNSPAGSFGTELAGTESHTASTYTYTGLAGNSIIIQIMHNDFKEFVQTYTLPSVDTELYARMTPDANK